MQRAGHRVEIASELRSFTKTPDQNSSHPRSAAVQNRSAVGSRIYGNWETSPIYGLRTIPIIKRRIPVGPSGLATMFELPYITAEASYSKRRDDEEWAEQQSYVVNGVRQAAVNICFTHEEMRSDSSRSRCLKKRLKRLPPFIDIAASSDEPTAVTTNQLVTVAMMSVG